MQPFTKQAFATAIATHFMDQFGKWGYPPADFDAQAPQTVTFVTRTAGLNHPAAALSDFNKTYFELLKAMYGNNLGRKRAVQPLAYAFLDFAGSRLGKAIVPDLPHVHALMLAHPDQATRLRALCHSLPLFSDAQSFDPTKQSLEGIATYCMKGLISSRGEMLERGQLWEVFPRTI